MTDSRLGFGVVAGLDEALLATLAREVERLGYGAFWINDSGRPDADGLRGLAVVASAAPSLRLGVGVLPLDRRSPAATATEIRSLGLPVPRLWLGVGSGGATAQPLGLVRRGVAELRELIPGAAVVVAALGPRMARLAGEVADGVLFNWATPERLAVMSALAAEGAATAGRMPVARWTYVRTAIGPDARERVAAEALRYAEPGPYGRAFSAMGVPFGEIGIAGNGESLGSRVAAYRAVVDGVVIRALPNAWTLDAVLEIARAAAPG